MRQLLALILATTLFPPFHAVVHLPEAPKSISNGGLNAQIVTQSNVAAVVSTGTRSPFTQIDFNWSYAPNAPACGLTAEDCFVGFTLTDTTDGVVLATPSTLGPRTLSYAYSPRGGVPYGNFTFSLVANGYDGKGKPMVSAPATVSLSVPLASLSAPTALLVRPGR
jgi:hypothetical protein